MDTPSASKRIHHLRKKNRNLLKKLETHSSEIHAELKKLKGSSCGQRLRSHSPTKDENQCNAWIRRNGSKQVSEALHHAEFEKVNNMDSSPHSSVNSDLSPGKDNIVEKDLENVISSSKYSCVCNQSEDSLCRKIIEANREILSSIDYSPKSLFLRRMKTKYLSRCCCGKISDRTKAKEPTINLEPPDSSVSSPSRSVSSCKSSIPEKTHTSKEEGTDFERIKKFRYLNWNDCHAGNDASFRDDDVVESKLKPISLSSADCKWREKYKINERLFAEPTGLSCRNLTRRSHCLGKSTKACGSNKNEVIVSIPSSLLDLSNSIVDGKGRGLKERDSAMKMLTKRAKPCNSMALRYQKGIA